MSLLQIRAGLDAAGLRPHTLALGGELQDLVSLMSSEASAVFYLTWGGQVSSAELLANTRWEPAALGWYRDLPEDQRMEVLGLVGFHVHELVHRIDLLTSPFGVGFHGRACLEFVGLQNDCADILAAVAQSADYRPLSEYELRSDAHTVNAGPTALLARVRYFDFLRGASRRHLDSGWGGDVAPLQVLGRDLHKVMIHEQSLSIAIPDADGEYVRPLTILESRALSVTALNLFYRLGADDWAAGEIAAYVRTYYEPREAFPDYRFLLDLYAAAWGKDNLPDAIEANGSTWLEQALMLVMTIGWYALHAPPFNVEIGEAFAFVNSSPVVRLTAALRSLEDILMTGRSYTSGVALLNEIDTSEQARGLGLEPVGDVLDFCSRYLIKVREVNAEKNSHPDLRRYFDYVLGLQQRQLERRMPWGYNSALANPAQGDVLSGFQSDDDLELLFYGPHAQVPASVTRWFALRENLLFRRARPLGFWKEVAGYLTTMSAVTSCPRCDELVIGHDTVASHAGAWTFACGCGHVFEINDSDTQRVSEQVPGDTDEGPTQDAPRAGN
jgi:hypothetical protein